MTNQQFIQEVIKTEKENNYERMKRCVLFPEEATVIYFAGTRANVELDKGGYVEIPGFQHFSSIKFRIPFTRTFRIESWSR